MSPFTAHVTDTYVATDISKFDEADIPDMSTVSGDRPRALSR